MKFSVQLPTDRVKNVGEFATVEAITELSVAVEKAGFDAAYVTEHPFPTDEWLAAGGHHALDPFVSLSVVAAATTTLKLHTNILVLAYRNPFLTAKAVASLDVVSGGRTIIGVGAGYLRGEFDALGAPFEDRNDVSDEALSAMKSAWAEEGVKLEGKGFAARGNTMLPPPVQKPHPTIWVGGNSPRAIRRAVDFGQGWSPFPLPAAVSDRNRTIPIESVEDLGKGIEQMREYAAKQGREETFDVNFVPFGLGMGIKKLPAIDSLHEQFAALEAVGVNWVSIGLPAPSRSGYLESIEEFGGHFL